ncbi:MAG: DUF222 domain-containing protein, partial [Frankiales bacterium]|nr:DUF222 domain-containing protein [Frankiales bacterium]
PVGLGFHPDWDLHDPIAWLTGDPSALLPLLEQPVDATDLILLEQVDGEAITEPAELIGYLAGGGRREARLASLRLAAEAAFANTACPDPRVSSSYVEAAAEQEVAYATRTSAYGASKEIERALALKETFPGFRAALAAGEITERHCAALVDATRYLTDPDVLATIEAAALEKARTLTASELRKHLDKLISRHDPDATVRAHKAVATRDVYRQPIGDGMAFLGVTHQAPVIDAVFDAIDAAGKALRAQRGGAEALRTGNEDAASGACRADAMAALVLGTRDEEGELVYDASRTQAELHVVMDLDTLRGERDGLALLNGTPIPAPIAREVAGVADCWRRVVVDPVDGHLLDYGTRQYLPAALREHVLHRDPVCRRPGCTRRAQEMDHALPFPEGSSDTANCGGLCSRCHQVKTAGHATIEDSAPDGSGTWVTRWRQRIRIPAQPVLEPPPRPAAPPAGPPPPSCAAPAHPGAEEATGEHPAAGTGGPPERPPC